MNEFNDKKEFDDFLRTIYWDGVWSDWDDEGKIIEFKIGPAEFKIKITKKNLEFIIRKIKRLNKELWWLKEKE